MLAVLPRFGEDRARALGLDAVGGELDGGSEGVGLVGSHLAAGLVTVDFDTADVAPPKVLQPAKEGPRTEQAAQTSVAQGREGVGDGGRGAGRDARRWGLARRPASTATLATFVIVSRRFAALT